MRADAASLPFQDESFDLVYTSRSLINVQERAMQDAAIRDLLRVVKPTGTVMLSENFEEAVKRLNQCKLRFRAGPPDNDPHNLRLNLADTLRMFERAGWAAERIDGYPIASFVAHVIVGRLTRRRGGRIAQRLLSPSTQPSRAATICSVPGSRPLARTLPSSCAMDERRCESSTFTTWILNRVGVGWACTSVVDCGLARSRP